MYPRGTLKKDSMIHIGDISRRIAERLSESARNLQVDEVRVGLGYVGVMLEGGGMGVAAVLRNELRPGCSTIGKAGTLAGSNASELLDLLVTGTNPLEKSLGLAAANALLTPDAGGEEQDSIALMHLSAEDRVAMVGYFGPLAQRIRKTGATLRIIEKDSQRTEEILSRTERDTIRGMQRGDHYRHINSEQYHGGDSQCAESARGMSPFGPSTPPVRGGICPNTGYPSGRLW